MNPKKSRKLRMAYNLEFVRVHDVHCRSKSYKLKLIEKLVVQYGIKVSFCRRSCDRTFSPHVYLPNLLSPCVSPKMETTCERESVRMHDIHFWIKILQT